MSGKRQTAVGKRVDDGLTDLEMLEDVLQRLHEQLKNEDFTPKVGDFLKALELKHKLKLIQGGKERLLEFLDEFRKEELPKLGKGRRPTREGS